MPASERHPQFSLVLDHATEYTDSRVWSHASGIRNCYPGQLTNKGKNSMFRLGKKLSELYVDRLGLINTTLPASQAGVRILSTQVSRTIESAMNLMRGMFPTWVDGSRPDEQVTFEMRSVDREFLHPSIHQCPRLAGLWSRKSEAAANSNEKQAETIMALLRDTVHPVEGLSAQDFYDIIACHEAHGVSMPPQVDEAVFAEVARLFTEIWWRFIEGDDAMCRLGSGRLVDKLLKSFADPAGPKLTLYSAHDSTLAFLLSSLGLSNRRWPPCSSQMILELHRDLTAPATDSPLIRLVYNNEVLAIPGCATSDSGLCRLDTFGHFMEKLRPGNLMEECAA